MKDPRFRNLVRTRYAEIPCAGQPWKRPLVNHNKLLWRYAGANGVKTGWTRAAGPCLVASATRHGIRLISVVLDSPDHYGDTRRLLDYGFRRRG